ncbi:MAG TPA: rhomboid family intramembrane serine protease [Panacibacter sp.]|nr:rhomboid family intramembrane serine protease [Panacibacter sp.]
MTEFRPGRFEILPTVVKNLLIINVLVFMAQLVLPVSVINMNNLFALHTWQSELFKPWQFITYMFMHSTDDYTHLLFNMYALWMFGSVLENDWGPKRFLTFYIVSGLGAALCHMIVLYFENQPIIDLFNSMPLQQQEYYSLDLQQRLNSITIGASGAVFGCLAAFGYLFAETYVYFIVFPLKAKWFVLLYAGFELFSAIQNSAGDTVAHFAHLGGALTGFLMVYFWNKTNRRTY